MKTVTVYLVQLPEAARETAQRAARENWARVQFLTARTIADAAQLPALAGRQLLVLGGANESEIGVATQMLDSSDLPRWAVVCHSREMSDLTETVAPEDWNVALLARAFRAALLQHELLRENLLLRGDLRTIARRVSHDARTPLGCIHTVCELLKEATEAESIRESTEVIRNSTAELGALIDRISLLVRATLDPLPPATFNMGTVVDAALQQLRPELDASSKKIRQPAEWPEVEGVPAWTETIWVNLLRNALAHGSRTGAIQLGWAREGGGVRCSISSPGSVASASQPRLLRRFHLLHQQPSAGIGLSLVERLVSLQGGACAYESGPDNRAIFSFTLRAPAGGREAAPAKAMVGSSAGPA